MCIKINIKMEELKNELEKIIPDFPQHYRTGERISLEKFIKTGNVEVVVHGNGKWEMIGVWDGEDIFIASDGDVWRWSYLRE